MSVTSRLDAFQRRHRWAGYPLAVVYKYADDQGNYLAALIAYYAFLSLFPLLLLLASVLGFFLRGDPELRQQLLNSALAQFPLMQDNLDAPEGLRGSGLGLTLAVLTAVYGSLGVAQAVQNAMNTAWAVPRNNRPNPLLARGRSILLLLTTGLTILGTTVLSAMGSTGSAFGVDLGPVRQVVLVLLSVALNAVVCVLGFRIATAIPLPLKHVLPGALAAAVAWQLLQSFGASYVASVVQGAGATAGVFAFVLGLIGWLFLGAVALVLCVEANVVRARRLYPRALLTPFTDAVDLTGGDQRAYTQYASAQRAKGFETVEVTFEHDGQNVTRGREEDR